MLHLMTIKCLEIFKVQQNFIIASGLSKFILFTLKFPSFWLCWQWKWWAGKGWPPASGAAVFRPAASGCREAVSPGRLFGTDFWALVSFTRRSVNDPFHLLPSRFEIWSHCCFLPLLDDFRISLKKKGNGVEHPCPASLCLYAGAVHGVWIKLNTMSFSPLSNWWLGEPPAHETSVWYSMASI